MFNSREYEYADITLLIGGADITGFRGVKLNIKQEKEAMYAKGNKPHSVQNGNKSVEGSLTFTQSAKEALNTAGKGSLLDIRNATIVIVYGNPLQGMTPLTKTIKGVSFTEDNDEWKQGDKFMETEIPFIGIDSATK